MKRRVGLLATIVLTAAAAIAADWWMALPEDATPHHVGRGTCIECHRQQADDWLHSDHDRAMEVATPETVLGDFDDQQFVYHDTVSKFSRDGNDFYVETDGPDGQPGRYRVEYTFGVRPLQQYLVKLDSGRMQALPFAWDVERNRWFHVYEHEPQAIRFDDEIHWTRLGGNWNHTCAECHSTDLHKDYDFHSGQYHTRFAELNVSCEACHGPGSLHVQLARSRSLFWDRKRGYALNPLKSADSDVQIETCARCHAHRMPIQDGYLPGDKFLDYYVPALLDTGLYYEDGQIHQEVYEYGSFLQSLMYRKNVRCTDCHDPHTTRIRAQGNALCIRCHTPGKYDVPAHHHHLSGGEGAQCVQCHMPTRKYMVVDPRRDHSIRPPRPDLSVQLGVPNACTGCHIENKKLPDALLSQLDRQLAAAAVGGVNEPAESVEAATSAGARADPGGDATAREYAAWLDAAQGGDTEARELVRQIDQWAADKIVQWYGPNRRDDPHYGLTIAAAMRGELEPGRSTSPGAAASSSPGSAADRSDDPQQTADTIVQRLDRLARRDVGPIVQASAISLLSRYPTPAARDANARALKSDEGLVRLAAVRNLIAFHPVDALEIWEDDARSPQHAQLTRRLEALRREAAPFLTDELRSIRMEAARALAVVPRHLLSADELAAFDRAFEEYRRGQEMHFDTGGAHANLAQVFARQGKMAEAEAAFRNALRVQPSFVPARTELAVMLQHRGEDAEAEKLLREAIAILPELPDGHYSLGLLLGGDPERLEEAAESLGEAARLAPDHARIRYNHGLARLHLRDFAAAERELLAAYERDRRSTDYVMALLSLHRDREDWRAALPWAERLYELAPVGEVRGMLEDVRRRAASTSVGPAPR